MNETGELLDVLKDKKDWLMERYEAMKSVKGSGKSIIATARKISTIVWCMLTRDEEFSIRLMTDKELEKNAKSMRNAAVGRLKSA